MKDKLSEKLATEKIYPLSIVPTRNVFYKIAPKTVECLLEYIVYRMFKIRM